MVWKYCRVVAFDVPGLPAHWTYIQRYMLLCMVVAEWSLRKVDALEHQGNLTLWSSLPLQVIRSYEIKDLQKPGLRTKLVVCPALAFFVRLWRGGWTDSFPPLVFPRKG